eukprot:COSAG06_NODE_101_length_24097_cov_15.305150_4_plen_1590_part_00
MVVKHAPMLLPRTPLGAAAVLCHLLVLGLVIDTRLNLADRPASSKSTARRGLGVADGGSSSAPLLNDDVDGGAGGDTFATTAELAELKVALAKQTDALSVLKTDTVELGTKLEGLSRTRARDHADAENDDGVLDRFMISMRAEMAELKADCSSHTEQDESSMGTNTTDTSTSGSSSSSRFRHRKQAGSCDGGSWAVRTQAAMDACCPPGAGGGGGGGHRRAQTTTCPMPATCPSAACAAVFVSYYEDCGAELQGHADDLPLDEFGAFYASCQEMESGAGLLLQPVAVQMFRVRVSTEGAAQAGSMFPDGGGGGGQPPPLDPLHPLVPLAPPPPPPPSPNSGGDPAAGGVEQFHAYCSSVDVATCVPPCNPEHHGFELLATIDGSDTKFSCNVAHGLYSWMGAASEGGYIGSDAFAFLSAILSHAAGTFVCQIDDSTEVSTAVDLITGQGATLTGGVSIVWSFRGEGAAFSVGAQASLDIRSMAVAATSGLAFRIDAGAALVTSAIELQAAGAGAAPISCRQLGMAMGMDGLTCDQVSQGGSGAVSVRGPIFISTSGIGFGMGSTKYMGDDVTAFREAVSTAQAGLYTLQMTDDTPPSQVVLGVGSAMRVSIIGDDSLPSWVFTGTGSAFSVAQYGHLSLGYITMSPAPKAGGASTIAISLGGEVSIEHSQVQDASISVYGTLSMSATHATDMALRAEQSASVAMDAMTLIGLTAPLVLPFACEATIVNSQMNNVQLQVDATGDLTVTGSTFRSGEAALVVSVSGGGVFAVSASQLLHDGVSDAFPCDGQNMHCLTDHAGTVVVHGPASINTVAPLVCADQSADSCLSGYVDMPSCLADIATGMTSCFVYLRADARGLGVVSVRAGQLFEVHGSSQPMLEVEADWEVASAASLVLADVRLAGGSDASVALQSEGDLTLLRGEISSGTVIFSSSLAVTECTLTSTQLIGSTASSQLSILGGMLTGSMVSFSGGSAVIGDSSVLANSPISITAATLSMSGCELQSDGSYVPLTVESGGSVMVSDAIFRSSTGDITAALVSEEGILTVGASQLVSADGSSDPFPCDGTLPDCVREHGGLVEVAGPAAITLASPLVCDVVTGECLADACLARGAVCAEEGPHMLWDSGSTCTDGVCLCQPVDGQDMAAVGQWWQTVVQLGRGCPTCATEWMPVEIDSEMSVCLAGDALTAVGEENTHSCAQYDSTYGHVDCSPTLTFPWRTSSTVELTVDCSVAALCEVLDRFIFRGAQTTAIFRRLKFADLIGRGDYGGALTVHDGASLSIISCEFARDTSESGGGIAAWGTATSLQVTSSSFVGCSGGGIHVTGKDASVVTLTGLNFRDNTNAVYWDNHESRGDHTHQLGTRDYTDDEANAAFGLCTLDTTCNSHGTCAACVCDIGWEGQLCQTRVTASMQCERPYTTLTDAWRAVSSGRCGPGQGTAWPCGPGGQAHGDREIPAAPYCHPNYQPTGVGGGGWYRFMDVGGDALALAPAGTDHCGTATTGWLSGWTGVGPGCPGESISGPPCDYNTEGRYPTAAEGVVEMTACYQNNEPCSHHVSVGVVRCDGFLLWQLPYAPDCDSAYCTAPSGLFGDGGR